MAKRIFTSQGLTFGPTNAGAVATTSQYMALKGQANQLIDVLEIGVNGMATSSTVAAIDFARVSTLETALIALAAPHSDAGMFSGITALASTVTPFVSATTTQPTPSNTVTDAKINLGLNLFGGIYRWNAAPTQQWQMIGNTAPGGESILWNNLLGGGASGPANAHIIYEPY